MKKIVLFIVLLSAVAFSSLSAQYNQIYGQPYPGGVGNLYTSSLDSTYPADYEVADNFSGLTEPITKLTFYGATGQPGWTPGPPAATEPFFIRFYNYAEEWTQPPVADPGILAPTTGTYTVNLYDSWGDGWNGASLDVYVNGTIVLTGITLLTGTGPESHTFTANAGEYILTVYHNGSYDSEVTYEILDPNLIVIATDGPNPTGIGSLPAPPLLASETGTYTVNLWDDYGDGWNGGLLDVFVNGILVLDDITLASGAGPATYTFTANAGDEIATIYTAGSWAYENWYEILDPVLAVIATDGFGGVVPQGIGFVSSLVVLEPAWANPVASFMLPATTTWVEDLPWGIWGIYMFEVELPAPVILADGWVSAQINIDGGATQWFLWAPGTGGDGLTWQRTEALPVKGSANLKSAIAQANVFKAASGNDRAEIANDMAFLMYTGTPGVTPVELSSFTATLTATNSVQLTWVSQSESQMVGYRVYRNTSDDQAGSSLIDHPLIPATNTSTSQIYTATDTDVEIGNTYYYWLESVDYQSSDFHGPVSVTVQGNVPPVLPEITSMKNAYPNPFQANSNTNIEVALKAGETGVVSIYNVNGQLVRTFNVTEGTHTIIWNGRDNNGMACSSGVYFYKLSTPSLSQTRKMVIVK
ncbi:MAG: T9SS type A sorting domain-containing protein [Candidatus Syntrophosphaera sp.]|nr:T9SS type A sorting domain-containing protein [Candidatus Syntrophosphaera sp.]